MYTLCLKQIVYALDDKRNDSNTDAASCGDAVVRQKAASIAFHKPWQATCTVRRVEVYLRDTCKKKKMIFILHVADSNMTVETCLRTCLRPSKSRVTNIFQSFNRDALCQ